MQIKNTPSASHFAYVTGILASDGNISRDGRHIKFISKDREIIEICRKIVSPNSKISMQSRSNEKSKKYFVLQFSNRKLVKFYNSIGIFAAKSKSIHQITLIAGTFQDFLRGVFDGDGSISIYNNKLSRQKQAKIRFYSASKQFLNWLQSTINTCTMIQGGSISFGARCYALTYGKKDAGKIIKFMYYSDDLPCLSRKKEVCGRVVELVYT